MPQTGHFVLHSYVKPPVTAGQYELVSGQTGLPFTVAEEHTHVTVASPRYVMPTEQILSTFPPANAEGAFGDRLPQIVLKRRTLPWERNPEEQIAVSTKPWLALVVVAEGEAELSAATPVAQCVTPGVKLLDAATDRDVEQGVYLAVTETVVKKIFPCKDDLELLVHVREVDINDTELANGDDDGWLAVVLANRLPVYDAATGKAVRYMACLVNLEGQLDVLPPPTPPADHFQWGLAQDWTVLASIDTRVGPDPRVMGGPAIRNAVSDVSLPTSEIVRDARRMDVPPSGASRTASGPALALGALDGSAAMKEASVSTHWASATEKVAAVALDPDAKRLVRDTMASGFRYPIELFAVEPVYRFPVLAHWSFTTNEGATFETLMEDLDVGLLGTIPERTPDAPPPARPAPEIVQTGHIALGHRARRGDALRAWYRGPLVPFPTLRDANPGTPFLAHSADQLRRVVPDGREDLSLASAFEIGRLLGLSQLSIVSALMRFRNEQFGAARVQELLAALSSFELPPLKDVRVDLSRFVAVQMIGEMVRRPEDVIGPRRPIADPGRELVVRGALDDVIASGLGIDLGAIQKTSTQLGIVAAIAQTAVPLASRDGTVPIDQTTVATLRAALTSELAHTLGVAAPELGSKIGTRPVVAPRTARKASRASAPVGPDPLDALIAANEAQVDQEES